MGPLVLEDHKSLFRNDAAFDQFLGAFEAKINEHGYTPIWGNDRLIGTAIDAATAKLVMQENILHTIATDPAARQGGLGRQIFRALDAEALNRGLERWVLEAARNNLPAIGLYKSEGFVEIGVRKGYYKTRQGPVDALVMARPVGA